MEFGINLPNPSVCNTINEFHEGVEFSIRFGTEATWYPIIFTVQSRTTLDRSTILIGDVNNLVLRGYATDVREISDDGSRDRPYSVQICNFDEQIKSVQLRWLQTSLFTVNPVEVRDVWTLDDVHVSYEHEDGTRMDLLRDSFDGGLK